MHVSVGVHTRKPVRYLMMALSTQSRGRSTSRERMKGFEPSTFAMARRRSSQLSYIREVAVILASAPGDGPAPTRGRGAIDGPVSP